MWLGDARGEGEFNPCLQRVGCVGETVWMTGRHVRYFGRRGDTHVERFPG